MKNRAFQVYLERNVLKYPDDPCSQPDVRLRHVPVGHPTVRTEPPHDSCVLNIHVFENPFGEIPVGSELIGQTEVVQLPGIGSQVEGMVLRAFAESTVT